jgi:hypothetical protein
MQKIRKFSETKAASKILTSFPTTVTFIYLFLHPKNKSQTKHCLPYGCWHDDFDHCNMLGLFLYWKRRFKELWALQSKGRTMMFLSRWQQLPPQTCCRSAKTRGATSTRLYTSQSLLELNWEI